MPSGTTTKKTPSNAKDQSSALDVEVTTIPTVTSEMPIAPKRGTADKRRDRSRPERAKKRPIALPVLIVDETVLLPHMSIPFPIEDDEAAMVVERASRMPLRQVLVL